MSDRTTFEAWAKTKEYWDFYTLDDVYQNLNTEAAWIAFQAATQIEREACAVECERISPHESFTLDFSSGIVIGAQQCASAIRDRSAP